MDQRKFITIKLQVCFIQPSFTVSVNHQSTYMHAVFITRQLLSKTWFLELLSEAFPSMTVLKSVLKMHLLNVAFCSSSDNHSLF